MQAYWRSVFTTYVKHLADTYVRPMHEPMQCGRVLNTYDSHVLHPYIPDTADVCVPTITWAVFVTYTSHVECTHTFQKCRHISAVHIGRRISHVYFSHRVDTYIRPRHTVKPAPYMVRMESLYVQYVNGLVICADCIMTVSVRRVYTAREQLPYAYVTCTRSTCSICMVSYEYVRILHCPYVSMRCHTYGTYGNVR